MNLPTREEAIKLMFEAGCSQSVIDHCLIVSKVAMNLIQELKTHGIQVDSTLVEIGALMHDIGRSKTHSVEHGVVGGEIARKKGLPELLAKIIERHVGAGITEDEAERIGLKRGNYVPETLEEKIVAYADKLVEGSRQVDLEVTVEKFRKELGEDHPAIERLRSLQNEIVSLFEVNSL